MGSLSTGSVTVAAAHAGRASAAGRAGGRRRRAALGRYQGRVKLKVTSNTARRSFVPDSLFPDSSEMLLRHKNKLPLNRSALSYECAGRFSCTAWTVRL